MRGRLVPIILVLLLGVIQWQLWIGRGGVRETVRLEDQLNSQKAGNLRASQENERLTSEVSDLKEGMEMVEERARKELGMVKPNEVFVQIAR